MAYTTINKSTDYFNTKLYTGNGSTNSVTVGFQPDFIWLKSRDTGTANHCLMDVIRGFGTGSNNTPLINSNNTDAEFQRDVFSSTGITSTGYELDTYSDTNANGDNFVGWNWKANGSGSSNSDGSITSTVSANTTAGFSIVAFNGNSGTVGHGLGVKPNFIVIKSRQTGGSNNWVVAHSALGTNMNDNYITLNLNSAAGSSSNTWGGEPTSQHFTVSSGVAANDNNIAFCFAEKTGYSKFGKYTGNGNANGPFIYTGFKPAFIILKVSSDINDWTMFDNKRPGYNVNNQALLPNLSNSESTDHAIDILSNGFKIKDNDGTVNPNGQTMIYMAFGQSIVGSNNVPCTAR